MTWSLAEIYRHPVKGLGEEALDAVTLTPGRALPHDRAWAVAHGGAEPGAGETAWTGPGSFVNQTHVPVLAQLSIRFDEATGTLALSHPDRPDIAVRPGTVEGNAALTEWLAPLAGPFRPGPYRVVTAPAPAAFTDFEDTHVSIATTGSRRALEALAGQSLAPIRFRMNLWLDGPEAWSDLDWIGREIEIGETRLKVLARDARCNATNANPATGTRDTQLPALLKKTFGHTDFGIYATVTRGGTIRRGDKARLV